MTRRRFSLCFSGKTAGVYGIVLNRTYLGCQEEEVDGICIIELA